MPTYMTRSGNGYLFRRSIPEPLRKFLKKREIKIPLGRDYVVACRNARDQAVLSDQLFDEARESLSIHEKIAKEPHLRYKALQPITEITDDLKGQLNTYWMSLVDHVDLERRANGFNEDGPAPETFRSENTGMLALLKKAWRDSDIAPFLPALHTTLMLRGYRLELPLEDEKRLCLQFLRSAMASHKLIADRDEGEDPPLTLSSPILPAGDDKAAVTSLKPKSGESTGTPLMELFEYWRDFPGRIDKTVDDVRKRIQDIDILTGNKPAEQLRKADFIAYRDWRLKLGKRTRTVEKDLSFIKTVLQFAFDADKIPGNPAAGITVPNVGLDSVTPFLDKSDLQCIFASPIYKGQIRPKAGGKSAAAWLPLLALYTGARLEEMCQLLVEDVITENEFNYLRILDLPEEDETEEGSVGKKPLKILKNENSRRIIPIHPALIKAGFLNYVEYQRQAKAVRLFPALIPDARYGRLGASWSKWWGRWRNEKLEIGGRERCFHAFRHVFKTATRIAKIDEQYSDAITGHGNKSEGRKYGKFPIESLDPMMKLIDYPYLKIDWVWNAEQETHGPRGVSRTKTSLAGQQASPVERLSKAQPRQHNSVSRVEIPAAMNGTRIYFDTEFSNLTNGAELISLGAVSSTGESFYAEIDPLPEHCSAFVEKTVLPLLAGPKYSAGDFVRQFAEWLRQFEQPALHSDSTWDIFVLRRLVEGVASKQPGELLIAEGNTTATLWTTPTIDAPLRALFNKTVAAHFKEDPRQHHALVDAQALRAGLLAIESRRQDSKD